MSKENSPAKRKTSQTRKATERIPVSPDTHAALNDFKNGLGITFDDLVLLMLTTAYGVQKDWYLYGRSMRRTEGKSK